MKARTIDEVCNKPPGSFQKHCEEKREFLQDIETERKVRIRARRAVLRDIARQLTWAA